MDSKNAVTTPAIGPRGSTNLANNDFGAGQAGNAAGFLSGEVASYPALSNGNRTIELDRGEAELWYRPTYASNANNDAEHILFTVGPARNSPSMWLAESDRLRLSVRTANGTTYSAAAGYHASIWSANQWVQILARWDNARAGDSLQIYVNGTRVDTGGAAAGWSLGDESGIGRIYIGAENSFGGGTASGWIDELQISRGLSSTADAGIWPDAAPADTGVAPDSGVWPDAAPADTGVWPDAAPADTGVWPDAAPADSGVWPDAAPADSGAVADSGSISGASVLLQSTMESTTAITAPLVGPGGMTTLLSTDFVTGYSGRGAQHAASGKVTTFPAASGTQQAIELDKGEIELWYRPSYDATNPDDTTHALVVVGDPFNAPRMVLADSDRLYFEMVDANWNATSVGTAWHAPLWTPNTWVNVRVTWDTALATDAIKLYVNGNRVDEGGGVGGVRLGTEAGIGSIRVGAIDGAGSNPAMGVVDELIIRGGGGSSSADAGVWPDAAPADSGVWPDAAPADSGVWPDAAPADSGVRADSGSTADTGPDAGFGAPISVCPHSSFAPWDPPGTPWGAPALCDSVPRPLGPVHNTAVPLTTAPAPSLNGSAIGRDWNTWLIDPMTHQNIGLFEGEPTFFRNASGVMFADWKWDELETVNGALQERLPLAEAYDEVRRQWHPDGGRGDNSVSAYSTMVQQPFTSCWFGVDVAGRLFMLRADGLSTTLAGLRDRRDVLPTLDANLTVDQIVALNKEVVGSFEGGRIFRGPTDLAMDPANPSIVYVADTYNHRIARVDLAATPVRITTFAGVAGTAGERDGPAGTALFSEPASIAILPNGTMFVADYGGAGAIRVIANGNVSTIATSPAVNKPMVIRLTSGGDLILGQSETQTVHRLRPSTGQMTQIGGSFGPRAGSWIWLDVDRNATIGPRDDIIVAISVDDASNNALWRLSLDGSFRSSMPHNGPLLSGRVSASLDGAGHYPWAVAIAADQARFVTNGWGTMGVAGWRPVRATDPDYTPWLNGTREMFAYQNGRTIYMNGTVSGGPPRPSFAVLRGEQGFGRLGLPNFDVLAYWSDAQLGAYIQSGMGGSVARPEITGTDLGDLIFFIRANSIRATREQLMR